MCILPIVVLLLAVCHQSVPLGAKPLEAHEQRFFFFANSAKAFPRQRRIIGGVVFCAVRIVSKNW
jgi:hypothetical protein